MPKDPELVKLIEQGNSVKIGDTVISKVEDLPETGETPAPAQSASSSPPTNPASVTVDLTPDPELKEKADAYDVLLNGLAEDGYDTGSLDELLDEIKNVGKNLDEAEVLLKQLGTELLGKDTFTKEELLEAAKAKAADGKPAPDAETSQSATGKTETDKVVADLGDEGKVVRFADGGTFVVKGEEKQAIGKVKIGVLQQTATALKLDTGGNYKELLARIMAAVEA